MLFTYVLSAVGLIIGLILNMITGLPLTTISVVIGIALGFFIDTVIVKEK